MIKNAQARLSEWLPDPMFFRLLAWQFRIQEPELRQLPNIVPSTPCAIDIGAWWGPWTYWLARQVPRVVAVEPQPRLAAFLERVSTSRVEVVNAAITDIAGAVQLTVPSQRRGQDALATLEPGVEGDRLSVRSCRLDDLDVETVGFIKIDVEGHELAVLRSGEETIERCRPTLFIEIEQRHLQHPIEDSFDAVTTRGYLGYFWLADRWHALDDFDVQRHQLHALNDPKSSRYVNNFLFVHRDDETQNRRVQLIRP